MKVVLCVAVALFGCTLAQQRLQAQSYNNPNEIPITKFINENNYDGSYSYSYETGNGISVSETGQLKNPGQKDLEAQTAQGSFSYTAPDGTPITVTWYADETGFHAEGAHLPTPPPIPEAILRSLQAAGPAQPAQPYRPAPAYQGRK
ncbi:hypothetical protein GE061_012647 [Apolygus lucorum]|uniref:Uncharacterized protein n=1 Tax=Apolygus lucorum TaxID=248454 RepID=A0A6A4JUY2_APOLU|nr:hypothetical protein GE061_012647 [Apolygus lucorum]